MLTYSQLVQKHGPGRIVKAAKRIVVASIIQSTGDKIEQPIQLAHHPVLKSSSKTSGLFRIAFTLTTSGSNDNNQFFVEDELALPEVYESPIGEAINQDHDQRFEAICGEIFSSEFVPQDGDNLSRIRCHGVIFSDYYPEVAYKARTGAGRWAAISMEAIPNPLEQVGKYLVVHNPKFVGASLVRFPANRHATIDQVSDSSIATHLSDVKSNNTMEKESLRLAANLLQHATKLLFRS